MRYVGRNPDRWLKLQFPDEDYEVVYNEFGEDPIKFILRDGMELTVNRNEKGVLESVTNGYVSLEVIYDKQGHFLGTKLVEV